MKGMLKRLMLSCKQAGVLIEKEQEIGLGFWEKFRLKRHLLLCDLCTAYKEQSRMLSKLLRINPSSRDERSAELKYKILNSIDKLDKGGGQ